MSQKFHECSFKKVEADNEKAGYRVVDMTPIKTSKKASDSDGSGPKSYSPGSPEAFSFVEEPDKEEKRKGTQSLCISPEDMMFMIKDTNTGAYYDIRMQDTATILSQEDQKLTKLSSAPSGKPWQEWWQKKRRQNLLLQMAAEKGELEKALDLLDAAKQGDLVADVNAKGLDEFTPLHFAASEGHLEVAETLLKAGANVDAVSSSLRTPLHVACNRGYGQMLELLMKNKANINAQDKDGNTPAHILSEGGWQEALEIYLKQKPNLKIKNIYGETPIEVAANVEVRNLLTISGEDKKEEEKKDESNTYTRTVVQNVILHNNRADMVKSLFFMAQRVGAISTTPTDPSTSQASPSITTKSNPKPKSRRIKIIEAAKGLSTVEIEEHKQPKSKIKPAIDADIEENIGPQYFDIIQLLGKGSFGEVYLVKYKPTGKPYAMKVLNKKRILGQNLVKYAKAERNVLCYTKNPFIVGLDFAFQTSDKLFLILEYCPGGDLGKLLMNETRLTEDRARLYAAEVLVALEDLHKRDIIFRDLKPDNVVLDEEGHAMLTDFGLSKEGVMDNISSRSFCGSVAYLAPEMLRKSGHGKAVDWYLFGVLIYEMLVGMPPYFSNNREKLFKNIESAPLKLPLYLSHEASNLIVALLNRNPNKRLGAGKEDANAIKKHPWFKGIDWEVVSKRGLKPPKPSVKPIPDAHISPEIFADRAKGEHHLKGWEYVNKSVI